MTADPAAGELARRVGLDAEVDCGNGKPLRPIGFDDVAGIGADLAGEIGAEHRRLAADPGQQLIGVREGITGEHPGLHRTAGAQVPHHRAGVDAGDADDALADEFVLQRAGGPPVRRARRGIADRVAGHPDLVAAALGVLVVPAGVADLRRGGHHDLAVVAGIGERLLVTGHAGGEHRLTEGLADGPERGAREDPSVLEDQYGPWVMPPPPAPSGYSRLSSPRKPVSISVPVGNSHRITRTPSLLMTLPASRARCAWRGSRRGIQIGRPVALEQDPLCVAGDLGRRHGNRGRRPRCGPASCGARVLPTYSPGGRDDRRSQVSGTGQPPTARPDAGPDPASRDHRG